MSPAGNPHGDGNACKKVIEFLRTNNSMQRITK